MQSGPAPGTTASAASRAGLGSAARRAAYVSAATAGFLAGGQVREVPRSGSGSWCQAGPDPLGHALDGRDSVVESVSALPGWVVSGQHGESVVAALAPHWSDAVDL